MPPLPSPVAGWTGGPYGVGSRFKLRHTRAIIDAIHSGELEVADYETMPVFGLQVGRKNEREKEREKERKSTPLGVG